MLAFDVRIFTLLGHMTSRQPELDGSLGTLLSPARDCELIPLLALDVEDDPLF